MLSSYFCFKWREKFCPGSWPSFWKVRVQLVFPKMDVAQALAMYDCMYSLCLLLELSDLSGGTKRGKWRLQEDKNRKCLFHRKHEPLRALFIFPAKNKKLGTPQSHPPCPWRSSQLTPLLLALCFLPLFLKLTFPCFPQNQRGKKHHQFRQTRPFTVPCTHFLNFLSQGTLLTFCVLVFLLLPYSHTQSPISIRSPDEKPGMWKDNNHVIEYLGQRSRGESVMGAGKSFP